MDYAPLETFLEQLVTALQNTDAELDRLREENKVLMSDRVQTAAMKKKLEALEKKLAAAEDRIKTKADHSLVTSIANEAASLQVATAVQEVKNELWTLKKMQETQSSASVSKIVTIEENIAAIKDSKADKTEVISSSTHVNRCVSNEQVCWTCFSGQGSCQCESRQGTSARGHQRIRAGSQRMQRDQ